MQPCICACVAAEYAWHKQQIQEAQCPVCVSFKDGVDYGSTQFIAVRNLVIDRILNWN